jgi:hypothetical protein
LSKTYTRKPVVECSRCRKQGRTARLGELICNSCYQSEPRANCSVCKEKRHLPYGSSVCRICIRRAARPAPIECAKCRKNKPPAKLGGDYCYGCQWEVNCDKGRCSGCNKDKVYRDKKYELCHRCNVNRHAPRRLEKYLETVSIPNEYNLTLFHHFIGLISCERVTEETFLGVRALGIFLQTHQFNSPLTWETILELTTTLPGRKNDRLRLCLKHLGELLLDPANDESLEECKRRIKLPVVISSLEADLVAVFTKYDLWLRTERRNSPTDRRNKLRTLGVFWKWCTKRGLTSLDMVEAAHVEEYLYIFGLQWKCGQCSFTKKVTARGEAPPTACERLDCRALHSYEKVIRCTERSTESCRGKLRIFYGWFKDVEERIETNPAPAAQRRKSRRRRGKRTRRYPVTIQYYDWEVVDVLLKSIEDPHMPAEEAIALYLLLHHSFYLHELQNVQIPSQCRPLALGEEANESLANLLTLESLPRELSRGKQSLGRSGEILHLEPADEPWLRDLVSRFMRERTQKLRNPKNPYLFVGIGSCPRTGHVGISYLCRLVERATARITGRACTINILGKCSRLLYSEFGGYEGVRHLRELGLEGQQALRYAWAKRVRVIPRQVNRIEHKDIWWRASNLTVPPIDVFGIPTSLEHELPKD